MPADVPPPAAELPARTATPPANDESLGQDLSRPDDAPAPGDLPGPATDPRTDPFVPSPVLLRTPTVGRAARNGARTTDVHITVGRVDVRVSRPETAGAPAARRIQPPRPTLEEYLRRRSAGGAP